MIDRTRSYSCLQTDQPVLSRQRLVDIGFEKVATTNARTVQDMTLCRRRLSFDGHVSYANATAQQRQHALGPTGLLPPKPQNVDLDLAHKGAALAKTDTSLQLSLGAKRDEAMVALQKRYPDAKVDHTQKIASGSSGSIVFPAQLASGAQDLSVVAVKWHHPASGGRSVLGYEAAWLRAIGQASQEDLLHFYDRKECLLVSRWIEGAHFNDTAIRNNTSRIEAVAHAIAKVHVAPVDADLIRQRGFVRFPWDIARWLPHVASIRRIFSPASSYVSHLHHQLLARLDGIQGPNLPIHGDVQPGNIIFSKKDGAATLIDFEFSSLGRAMFDLGFFCSAIHLSQKQGRQMLEIYHRCPGIVPRASDEKELALYITYQRLFRHVASHKEYKPGSTDLFALWLKSLHDDLEYLQEKDFWRPNMLTM